MKSKKLLAIGSALLLVTGFVSLTALPANAGSETNQNETTYWENQYPGSTCYKDDGAYGSVTGEGSNFVTLTGDHDWVALIVNSGNVDTGNGPGNALYLNPSSGTPYASPLNNGGNQGAVSHWIVCIDTTPPPVTTVPAATFTDLCGIANDAIVGGVDTASIDYTITDNRVDGVGTVTVSAVAQPGYTFADGAYTGPWSHTFTNVRCPIELNLIAPSAFDPTCPEEPNATSGYIQLDIKDHLHYAIDGVPTTQAKNDVAPGTYTISVTVDDGYTLVGPSSWQITVNPPFCPPTLALLSTTASMSNLTCSTGGSYTLAATEGIEWFVNGSLTATPAGTYPRSTAGTVTVEAKLADPVNDGWEDGAQKTWTFNFTNPADCLPTLAFTGSDSAPLGLLLAGGFLLVGGAVIAVEKRLRREAR